jgi:hypothetical protein
MNKLNISMFVCGGLNRSAVIGGLHYNLGLFGIADLSNDPDSSKLCGSSRASQDKVFFDDLVCSLGNFNKTEDSNIIWDRSDSSHLDKLFNLGRRSYVLGQRNFIVATSPVACDGRFHVSRWRGDSNIKEVVPLREVSLSNTLFLMISRSVSLSTA